MLQVSYRAEKKSYADGVPCGEAKENIYREFTEKAPWPERMLTRWKWALETQKDWFLALEDDVVVAPDFWRILEAMCIAWPNEFIGLSATHSLGPSVALQGRRSYYTPKLLGWAWACPMYVLEALYEKAISGDLESFSSTHPQDCEDSYIIRSLFDVPGLPNGVKQLMPRYPVPTITDQLYLPTTNPLMPNGESDNYTHMKASVTWRAYSPADMVVPNWWQTPATKLNVEYSELVHKLHGHCSWCYDKPGKFESPKNPGTSLCYDCFMAPYRIVDATKLKALV
jgi:hypothetical protein